MYISVGVSPHLADVVQAGDLWAQASVDTQELLVEEGGQRQTVKGLHAGVVYSLRVFYFTCTNTNTHQGQSATGRFKTRPDKTRFYGDGA